MDYKVNLLEKSLTTYEKENELFDRKKFDDVQVLSVVFKAMDLVKNLAIHDVSQQRELLNAFASKLCYDLGLDFDNQEEYIDEYMESI